MVLLGPCDVNLLWNLLESSFCDRFCRFKMTKLTYTATDSLSGETPTFRRICGWCTCKFSWPKFQKMGFTAHHSASYVYPSMIWWGIFVFPFWQRIYGLRFWRHAVSRNSMTSNRNVSETVIFISRMTSTSNFNTLMFVRLYLLLCTTTDCTRLTYF